MLEQLQQLILDLNPKSYGRVISRRPDLLNWIMGEQARLATLTLPETVYCLINACAPAQCSCGNPALFNTVVKGYRKFCSVKCPHKRQQHSATVKSMWSDSALLSRMVESRKKTCREKYGVENAAQHPDIKEKIRKTNQHRYGADTPLESDQIKQRIIQQNLQKYGVEKPLQSRHIQQKARDTFERNHGAPNQMQLARAAWQQQHGSLNPFEIPCIREKSQNTMIEKYGVKYAFQSPELYQKHVNTHLQNWGRENNAQTHLTDAQYQLLTDPIQLKSELEQKSLSQVSQDTGIRKSLIQVYHDRYQWNIIPQNSRSGFEDEIAKFLDHNNVRYQRNNRKLIAPQEVDFLIQDQLAIEFNGLYWHSEIAGNKPRLYHQQKMRACAAKNVRLITIWDDEWTQKPQICQSVILSLLNRNQKIPARKCTICEITNSEIRSFLNQNHLQGHSNASVNIVLKYQDQIVCAMTFAKSRYNKKTQWELLRAVSQIGVSVQGGMSKIWNYFIQNHQPESVVSYCDRRWFIGELYQQLGFTQTVTGSPTYWYTNYKQRFHRSGFTKKALVSQGADPALSEWTIMQSAQWDRVWDCGQDTWIWSQ